MDASAEEAVRAKDTEDRPEAIRVRGTPLVLNEAVRLLHSRKSVRSWDRKREIPDDVLNTVLWAGVRASSSGQTYAIIDVRDRDKKNVIYPREDLLAASQEVWAAVKEAGFLDE